MFCTRCGKENAEGSAFCFSCGTRVGEAQPGKRRQWSKIAGILDIVSAGVSFVIFLVWAIIWFLGAAALVLTALARDEFRQPLASSQDA